MTVPTRVLVVGAAASGLATVEALRRKGYAGGITVLGDEPHAPYDRPPLSKQVLSGQWEPAQTALRTPEVLGGLDAEFVPGDAAIALDTATRTVRTERGRRRFAIRRRSDPSEVARITFLTQGNPDAVKGWL